MILLRTVFIWALFESFCMLALTNLSSAAEVKTEKIHSTCSTDLHNQKQVIERLAQVMFRVLGTSYNKAELAVFNLYLIPQIKKYSNEFGLTDFEEMVQKNIKI